MRREGRMQVERYGMWDVAVIRGWWTGTFKVGAKQDGLG